MKRIDDAKMAEKIQLEKENKAKQILDDILKQLKDFVMSSQNIAEIKSKIDMLAEIDPQAAQKAKDILDKIETMLDQQMMNIPEDQRLKKMGEMIEAHLQGDMSIQGVNNDNMAYMDPQDEYRPDRIDGSISVSI